MANKIMKILFQLKGQLDGSVENSFSVLSRKTAATSKTIHDLQKNLQRLKYDGTDADIANLQKAIPMHRRINELIRDRAKLMSKLNKSEQYAQAKENFVDKVGEFAQVGAGALALGAVFQGAVRPAMDFEQQMSRVAAISNADAAQMAVLNEKAKEMGMKLPYTMQEAGKAFEYMAMAGWKTEQMTAGIESVMKLALASGEDLGRVSDIVTDAMTAFGMSADETNEFTDVLARTASRANTTVGLMGNTFQYIAPLAGAMKYSIQDMGLAIGMMASMGIKGSQAGTALRGILSRLVDPPTEAALAMEELGIELAGEDGKMRPFRDVLKDLRSAFAGMTDEQKSQKATTIAGTEALSGFLALINTSEKDMKGLQEEIDNAAGATDEMAAKMTDNAAGALSRFESAMDAVKVSVGEAFLPSIKMGLDGLAEYTAGIGDFLKNNQSLIRAVAIGGSVVVGLALAWRAVNLAISISSLLMAASPMTWIILGIGALVAALYYLYENWDVVSAWFANNWLYIKNVAIEKITEMTQFFSACWDRLVSYLQPFFDAISEAAAAIWDSPAAKIALFVSGPIGWVIGAASWVINNWEAVKTFFSTLWDSPLKALDDFVSSVREKLGGIGEWVAGVINSPIFGSAEVASSGTVAQNAAGGIYEKGAFLTTFAEESGESAIPHTPNARNIGLLARTNEIMGNPLGRSFAASFMENAASQQSAGQSLGANNYTISIPITINGGAAAQKTAVDIGAQVEAAIRRALAEIEGQKARVSYE